MPEFLVEAYHPSTSSRLSEPGPSEVASAVEELNGSGSRITLDRAILVPEEETCFYLFEASAPETALAAVARPGISVLRILPAVSLWVGSHDTEPFTGRATPDPSPEPPEQGGHLRP